LGWVTRNCLAGIVRPGIVPQGGILRPNYGGNKKRKEEVRRKKQEEKRNKRLNKSKNIPVPETGGPADPRFFM
jgi:hypothetical protein